MRSGRTEIRFTSLSNPHHYNIWPERNEPNCIFLLCLTIYLLLFFRFFVVQLSNDFSFRLADVYTRTYCCCDFVDDSNRFEAKLRGRFLTKYNYKCVLDGHGNLFVCGAFCFAHLALIQFRFAESTLFLSLNVGDGKRLADDVATLH